MLTLAIRRALAVTFGFGLVVTPITTLAQAPPKAPPTIAEKVKSLEDDVTFLQTQIDSLIDDAPASATYLDCDSENYLEMRPMNSHLLFLVRCDKIEPYLEGFRITLAFANPNQVVFHGIEGRLGHGVNAIAAIKTKEAFASNEIFRWGKWQNVVVTLNPALAKDVRTLRLEFSVGVLSLAP